MKRNDWMALIATTILMFAVCLSASAKGKRNVERGMTKQEVKEEYNIKVTDDPKVLEKEYQIVVIGTHHKMFDSIDMNTLITDKGFICDIYGIHKPRN